MYLTDAISLRSTTSPEILAASLSRKLVVEKLQHVPVRHWSLTEVAVKSANVLKEYRLAFSSDCPCAELTPIKASVAKLKVAM